MAFVGIDLNLYQLSVLIEKKAEEEEKQQQQKSIEMKRQQIREKKNKLALLLNTDGMVEGEDGEGSDNPALWKEDTSSMDIEINTLKLNNSNHNNNYTQPIKKAKNAKNGSNGDKFVYKENSFSESYLYCPTYMTQNNRSMGMGNNTTTAVITGCKRPVWC